MKLSPEQVTTIKTLIENKMRSVKMIDKRQENSTYMKARYIYHAEALTALLDYYLEREQENGFDYNSH